MDCGAKGNVAEKKKKQKECMITGMIRGAITHLIAPLVIDLRVIVQSRQDRGREKFYCIVQSFHWQWIGQFTMYVLTKVVWIYLGALHRGIGDDGMEGNGALIVATSREINYPVELI